MTDVIRDALVAKDAAALREILNPDCAFKQSGQTLVHDRETALKALLEIDFYESVSPYLGYAIADVRMCGERHQIKFRTGEEGTIAAIYIAAVRGRRIRMDIAYEGSAFLGFQRQSKGRSVQKTLENALFHLFDRKTDVHGASRTDRGVHALGQVVHFDTDNVLPADKLARLVNRVLPADVVVLNAEDVPVVFHARYDATNKTYRYRIVHEKDPLTSRHAAMMPRFDIDDASRRLGPFVGTHDFAGFCKTPIPDHSTRTIFAARVERVEDETAITITGSGFLRHMVRYIVGAVTNDALKGRDDAARALRGETLRTPLKPAPAEGLYLEKVGYE